MRSTEGDQAADILGDAGDPSIKRLGRHGQARHETAQGVADDDDRRGRAPAGFAEGLEEGSVVRKGQLIGWVGDTGNATPGGWHLHFEVRPGPQLRYGSQPSVDPVPLLAIPTVCNVY